MVEDIVKLGGVSIPGFVLFLPRVKLS